MFNLSENSCYLTVIRPPKKSVQHCATGSTQIERVSFQNSHADLQYSIKHSKMLSNYKKKYPYSNPFDARQCDQIYSLKNITENNSKFYVGKTLRQLHCALYASQFIQSYKKQKYNSQNSEHEYQLLQIWKNLKPQQKLNHRISNQWISVGFQANDPATDFRGSGSLGLYNLNKFSSTKKSAKAFQVASAPDTYYFFSSAGLYFTMLASQLLKERKIGYEYWVHNYDQQILQKFQAVYQMLFVQFTRYWLQSCPNKTILHFNQNLKDFYKQVKNYSPQILKAKIEDALNQNQ